MNSFYFNIIKELDLKNKLIGFEKRNVKINDFFCGRWLHAGDVVEIFFFKGNEPIVFEGICLGVKNKKKMFCLDVSFILRNVILGVGIEVVASYYYNRLYFLKISNYKRKFSTVNKSRIFFIRHKANKLSRVK
jgi:ribosomal protein L19